MEPRLDVAAAAVRAAGAGEWVITWRLRNDGPEPVLLRETWLPHGKFRGDRRSVERSLVPRETADLELPVCFTEAPGSVVENCFLILRVGSGDEEWRVLARVRVTAEAGGAPSIAREVVTAQRAGFGD